MNAGGDTHSSEANLEANPDGSKLYGVWAQWVFDDLGEEVIDSEANMRRVWWIDNYRSTNTETCGRCRALIRARVTSVSTQISLPRYTGAGSFTTKHEWCPSCPGSTQSDFAKLLAVAGFALLQASCGSSGS